MKKLTLTICLMLLTLLLISCTTNDTLEPVDIQFDINGGYWSKEDLEKTDALLSIEIVEFDNYLGSNTDITLFKPNDMGLRWYYKAFIRYEADLNTYVVLASDPYTAGLEHLNVPEYDYILAVHFHNPDIESSPTLNKLFTDGVGMQLIFDEALDDELTSVNLEIYTATPSPSSYVLKSNAKQPLPIPVLPNFDFVGWYLDDEKIEQLSDITYTKEDTVKTLTAKWESYSLESLDELLDSLIPSHATENITLPTTYSGYTLQWSSSHPLVISSNGKFNYAYEPTIVTLTATITNLEHQVITRTYNITVPHKKPLNRPIASGYIWRNYNTVDDRFFQTLDIINTAFLTADANGNFSSTTALNDIYDYIFPKAKIHGNWVVFSIAPESKWSDIAISATKIENFANNIVDIINTHGFDGVDIDWETPRSGEQVRYSNMMKVIYEKVKANNPNHLVTTAITGGMWQPPMYNLSVSNAYLDYINVMTYSMSSSAGSYQNALYNRSGFHNPESRVGQTPTSVSIDASVPIFNSYGVPNSKLIFGLAFYGVRQARTFNTSTEAWGPWTATSPSAHYPEIIASYLNNPDYQYYFDDEAGVPYLLKKDGTVFLSYDDPKSIRLKAEYVKENNLGGLMFWEYGTDPTGTLLEAMRTHLSK